VEDRGGKEKGEKGGEGGREGGKADLIGGKDMLPVPLSSIRNQLCVSKRTDHVANGTIFLGQRADACVGYRGGECMGRVGFTRS